MENKKPTILVVDDERSVRELVCLYLESAGYKVYQAAGGREAVDLVITPDINIDLLITDIIMPYMHGRELANRICTIKHHIKVLFISAYSAEILTSQNLCPEGADYVRKPFTREILLDRVSRVWGSGFKWKELISKQTSTSAIPTRSLSHWKIGKTMPRCASG
ncbi:MAG: putative multi-sensor signal transduction histidine kinase [Fibrobacteres bacterium]|nr:putative multi-sensor signal transduction histidine kinase [Fibrobacterota bacterium]